MNHALASSSPRLAVDSRAVLWTGRVLTGLIALFLLVDAGAKIVELAPVMEASKQLGFSADVIRPLGIVLALGTILHLVQRTQLVGAVLVTAYLGGATATHVHTGTPYWCPVTMGVLLWVAFAMRSKELRALIGFDAR